MYKIIDLFAGAGGLSLGFEMTGKFEIKAFVENNDNAAKTYQYNNKHVNRYKDIKDVDFKEILENVGEVDVVIGGPPCQGFSNANRQKRKIINGNNELVKRYVGAIKELQPKIFVMENVKTIASDKHSFYLTVEDESYIKDELKLKINKKDNILYDKNDLVNEIYDLLYHDFYNLMLSEKEYFCLRTLLKRKKNFDEYLSKQINIKPLKTIIDKMKNIVYDFEWYEKLKKAIVHLLENLLLTNKLNEDELIKLGLFCDIQGVFKGVRELNDGHVINEILLEDNQIISRMDTYYVIDYIKQSFLYLGYSFKDGIVNAAAFGVPQSRERFILIGMKEELIIDKDIELPESIFKKEEYVNVKQAIYDLKNYEPSVSDMSYEIKRKDFKIKSSYFNDLIIKRGKILNHACTNTGDLAKERFKHIAQGSNFHSLPDDLKGTYENPERTQNTIYKRLVYNQPSDTVVNVRKSMWIHPELDRAISAREAARLQSFPDDYKFIGTKDSVYQQIGNAVPPLLGRAIAEKVLELLGDLEFEKLKDIKDKFKL
ncbi:DNA cytosine methyltransferase [Clostridium chromiireducens]|uniref:Cytosine-specific methyltransferase n=1 Tax=Clostridium chromiireducens TaxID=225345 RepID=A0A399IKB9_9CLOT|nr:DNA cytosine methyltransferase [Clostridium chromiireducens]RII32957.1 DNA cytosine methyltransferase [Clostridium chromiireducens]